MEKKGGILIKEIQYYGQFLIALPLCKYINFILLFRYGFQDLESAISDYLKAVLSIKNVCLVYDMAALYGLSKLMQSCCYFMDRHAGDVIQHESFSNLSRDSLRAIISRFVKLLFQIQ